MFAWRMLMITGEARYADLIERGVRVPHWAERVCRSRSTGSRRMLSPRKAG